MGEAIGLLWLPFLVALVLTGIHAYLGLQVLARNIIFVDLALAQIAALGATVAFMLGHAVGSQGSYAYSALFTIAAAMLLAATRGWSRRVPQEALIGVIYVVAAAAAFLLVDKAPQGTEHIKQVLTGNILTTGIAELAIVVPLYVAIGAALWAARARLADPGVGWRAWLWDLFFYACFGVVVTSSVALAGVLLVFSFLIVPAAIGVLYADGVGRQLAIGWVVGTAASFAGLVVSYSWDLPTGSSMVCVFGVALALAGVLWPIVHGGRERLRQAARAVRAGVAALFVVSGTWLMVAPRADQPLLDSVEVAVPGLLALYMSDREFEVFRDAGMYAERYRRDTERLNEKEHKSRWQGEALSDTDVRRLSSFLQSYGEMRKGEQFVQGEVRARARERTRWWLGAALIALGALVVPWRRRRSWHSLTARRGKDSD
jgi:zinc/manganese transport system permease protein